MFKFEMYADEPIMIFGILASQLSEGISNAETYDECLDLSPLRAFLYRLAVQIDNDSPTNECENRILHLTERLDVKRYGFIEN